MFSLIKFLLRLAVFWLLFFLFFRILFLFAQFNNVNGINFSEITKIFYEGFRLDLSAICYLLAFPFLLLVIQLFTSSNLPKKINFYFHLVVIFLFVGLGLANIIIYRDWGTLLNSRALYYALQPKEVIASLSTFTLFISVSVWVFIFLLFFYLFRKQVNNFFPWLTLKTSATIQFIILAVLIFSGARGGWQLIPINESASYFSTTPLLNQIATNYIWYLGHNLLQSQITNENPYKYFDDDLARGNVKQLYNAKKDSTVHIFNIDSLKKPNLVFIILESWSADVIEALGGDKNVTPNFNQLKNDGILFSNIYSSGFRTDQGIVSILSGFPAQPNNSIIRHPEKTGKLPSLIREFKKQGYKTSFYYGGEIAFANMNTYLLDAGCDKLITKDDFTGSNMSNKWGAYDEFVLNKQAAELTNEKEPFISVLLTLSTHEPFDIPVNNPFGDDTEPNKFRGAAYYTDMCLRKYFEEVKSKPWFDNTLFILLADHGHRLPGEHAYDDPLARRMTMMFYGNLIKPEFKGKILSTVANQNDVAATLLSQLNSNHDAFKWSNNIFNANRTDFAYISLDYGFSWLTPKGYYVHNFDDGTFDFPKGKENIMDEDLKNGKSYLQCLYRDFLDY